MSFLDTVAGAKTYLREHGRVSLRALRREFSLDDGTLDELIDELVEIQRVAVRDGRAIAWAGGVSAAPTEAPVPERDPRDYTPRHLAEKILRSKSALEGERKQVTVLFADVKGSMDLQERIDPEDWHRILDRFFQILADGVHRFEGTVNQYTGDGIMALFGAPIAHEDHAQRACYACLHLLDELRRYATEVKREHGIGFSVRMGLNSGEVIVGKIGDDLRMDYTAQGHTVGLAARVEELASPDTCYLTGDTTKLVSHYFELEDLGEFAIRGVRDAVPVFQLKGVGPIRTRFELSRARGFSKFVGRGVEIATLEGALERAGSGHGQVIGVVAEAGVGKSRLCYEFLEGCRAKGLRTYEAHGLAHGKSIPFLPILELVRSYLGVEERDSPEAARERIAGRFLLTDESLREVLPLAFDFLGIPDPQHPAPQLDPEVRQRHLYALVKRVLTARGQRETTVTLIEDLHWLDTGSESFLEVIVEAMPATHGLLIVNYRPEYHAAWMQKSNYQQLPLVPLEPEAIQELLRDLLGEHPSLAQLHPRVHERTGGNPFFIEEVVRSLVEAGCLVGPRGVYRLEKPVREIEIPATVQPVLSARIDRLAEREKQVLQIASVIGKTFGEPLLREVCELPEPELAGALSTLTQAEFIYEASLYPQVEYAFKHPLTQEVALGSQLQDRRRRVHAAVAGTFEAVEPEKLNEQAALVAHHWQAAGENLKAARWHARAGGWVGQNDRAAAHPHWQQVRALLETVPESPETVGLRMLACGQLIALGWALGATADEMEALFAEGRPLAEKIPDPRPLAQLIFGYATFKGLEGDVRSYVEATREAVRRSTPLGDIGLELASLAGLGTALSFSGEVAEALATLDRVVARQPEDLSAGRDLLGFSPYLYAVCQRAMPLSALGRHSEARAASERAIELAREHDDMTVLCMALGTTVFSSSATGERGSSLARAQQSLEIAERFGSSFIIPNARYWLGFAYQLEERWAEAAELYEQAIAYMEEKRVVRVMLPQGYSRLGVVYQALGDGERGLRSAQHGVELSDRSGARYFGPQVRLDLAHVQLGCFEAGEYEQTTRILDRAEEITRETGAIFYLPQLRETRARLARLLDDEASWERELREAQRLFVEMGATGHADRVAKELADREG